MTTTTTTTQGSYKIHETQVGWIKEKIAKLNRKAVRLGVPEIELNWTGEVLVQATDALNEPIPGRAERFLLCTVNGSAPRVAGWTFVATLQHADEAGTVIRAVPGLNAEIPLEYRTSSRFTCAHCNTLRYRKDTYLLRSEAGEFKQVGSNCLADFLGGLDPHKAAQWASWAFSVEETLQAGGGFGIRDPRIYLGTWLTAVATIIRVTGKWTSRSAARAYNEQLQEGVPGLDSTADLTQRLLWASNGNERNALARQIGKEWGEIQPTPEDERFGEAALEWVRATFHTKEPADRSDFEHNLVVATTSDSIQTRSTGIAAAAVGLYYRHLGKETERKARAEGGKNSSHLGQVNERLVFWAKPLGQPKTFEGAYGTTYLYKLITREGNLLTWFASGRLEEIEKAQDYVALIGTVKKHDIFREEKQTVVNRVAVATPKQIAKAAGADQTKKAQAVSAQAVETRFEQLSSEDW